MTEAVFWTAVQGIGTVIAAVAAIVALLIAGSQLRQLIASNRLLAASNDTMAESNIALTRPYVVVDYEFRPSITRSGGTSGTSVFVVIRNDGRTPAHNIRMAVDRPFAPISQPDQEGWRKSVEDLNRMMNGETALRSLTSTRPLKYYLDDEKIFGVLDGPAPAWTVRVTYEDAEGRRFTESFHRCRTLAPLHCHRRSPYPSGKVHRRSGPRAPRCETDHPGQTDERHRRAADLDLAGPGSAEPTPSRTTA